jgi:hypothetical protein
MFVDIYIEGCRCLDLMVVGIYIEGL